MSIRILKIAPVVCVGAPALLYAISNLLNLEGACGGMTCGSRWPTRGTTPTR